MKTYAEKLRDPRWQRRRLEILQKSEFACVACEETDRTLHIHHLLYEKGKDPWDYPDKLLLPLCENCHKYVAAIQHSISDQLAEFPVEFLDDLRDALSHVLNDKEHPFIAWSRWMKAARIRERAVA